MDYLPECTLMTPWYFWQVPITCLPAAACVKHNNQMRCQSGEPEVFLRQKPEDIEGCHSVHDRAVNTFLVGALHQKTLQAPSQEERQAQAETPKLQSVAEQGSRKDHASSVGVGFLRHLKYSARVISSDLNQTSLCTRLSTVVTCFLIHLQSTAFLRWTHSLACSNPLPCACCHSAQECLSQIDPRVVSMLLWDPRLAGSVTEK
ncbi:uncharacterized protein LOC128785202 [Vidua chalybeata]|uniref:uncharacterized protein LOC128785202 n=1 Tax=Vidua chalybeata TaxID=81927 RepID=UPI0023A7C3E5|nr:uncharacterized protein LOC128785202 [Vidua chalybeata]